MKVDDALRTKVIEGTIAALHKEYVFPAVAEKIEKALRKHVAAKRYASIRTPEKLAKTLTEDLVAAGKDKHLCVVYSERPLPDDAKHTFVPSPEEKVQMRAHSAGWNALFVKVERLPGNIGYLRLDAFLPPLVSAQPAAAAVGFVADTDELIIDLRHNGGGSPECVAMMASYLFDGAEPQHLNDIYWRPDDSTRQYWTSPVTGRTYADKPVHVLTSARTFSAAEDFAYSLQMLKRAKIVGEVTRGGAHPGGMRNITPNFGVGVPMGRSINPVSNTNWESVGVKPNVKVSEAEALDVAYLLALRSQKKRLSGRKAPKEYFPNLADEIEKALAKAEAKAGSKRARRATKRKRAARPRR